MVAIQLVSARIGRSRASASRELRLHRRARSCSASSACCSREHDQHRRDIAAMGEALQLVVGVRALHASGSASRRAAADLRALRGSRRSSSG
jgi:hypothetical protein